MKATASLRPRGNTYASHATEGLRERSRGKDRFNKGKHFITFYIA